MHAWSKQDLINEERVIIQFIVSAIITALRVFTHLGSILKALLIESQFGVLMLICCCPDFLVPEVV